MVVDKANLEQFCRKTLKRNPKDVKAWVALGTVVADQAERERCLRKSLELDPKNASSALGHPDMDKWAMWARAKGARPESPL